MTTRQRVRRSQTTAGFARGTSARSTTTAICGITGRKKEITITSGGKSITPANIEAALREIRWVSEAVVFEAVVFEAVVFEAVVFGDARPCLVAVLTRDPDEAPALASRLGVQADIPVMPKHERVLAALAGDVEKVNARFARVEQVKRFAILDRDLTQETGELTPTQKAKRPVVHAKFKDVLDSVYQ